MKRRYEQGEGSNAPTMTGDQVTRILTTITTIATTSEAHLEQHSTECFHEVKNILRYLTNEILEKVLQADLL